MDEAARRLTLRLKRSLYSRPAVLATAYRYLADHLVEVDQDGEEWLLTVRAKGGSSPISPDALAEQFRTDLVDHQLRCDLEKTFRPVREAIVAKAFGKGA